MKNIAILGVRFLALFVLIRALMSLEFIPSVLLDEYVDLSQNWYFFLSPGLYFILSGALFFGSKSISSIMTPKTEEHELQIDNYEKFSAVLFSTVGLLIVFWSIQSLLQSITSIINMSVLYPDNPDMKEYRTLTIIFGGVIQLILGLLLFIGGKKLAKWWYDFRNWT